MALTKMIIRKLWSILKQQKSEVDKYYTSQVINITLNLKHLEKEEKADKIPQVNRRGKNHKKQEQKLKKGNDEKNS